MLLNVTRPSNLLSSSVISTKNFIETGCHSDLLTWVMKIQSVLLVVFGFLANLFSFIVLIQPRLRRRPTFCYLAFLSLSNACLSLIHALFTILGVYFELPLENLPLFIFCRLLNRFGIDFLTHFSLCTLTAVDFDRVRTVTRHIGDNCRATHGHEGSVRGYSKAFRRVCWVELSFGVALFLFNLHWLTSYGYTVTDEQSDFVRGSTMCTIPPIAGASSSYEKYLNAILPVIEMILFGVVPLLSSIIATVIILKHISLKHSLRSQQNKHLKRFRRRMELHLSILLISLNCAFILFTTPHNVFNIYVGQVHRYLNSKTLDQEELCPIAVAQKSLDLLQQCYFMSTFFLYILANRRFREESWRLLRCVVFKSRRSDTRKRAFRRSNKLPNLHLNMADNDKRDNHLEVPCPSKMESHYSMSAVSQCCECDALESKTTVN